MSRFARQRPRSLPARSTPEEAALTPASACFQDDRAPTYEIPDWDAVYQQITQNYCADLEKVFIGGYSSGAWMEYTTAFARGSKVRPWAPEPAESAKTARRRARFITGDDDGAKRGAQNCGFPSAENCKWYEGCPAAFPVVYCMPAVVTRAATTGTGSAWGTFGGSSRCGPELARAPFKRSRHRDNSPRGSLLDPAFRGR